MAIPRHRYSAFLRAPLRTFAILSAVAFGMRPAAQAKQKAAQPSAYADAATIAQAVPLRIATDHRVKLKPGQLITGRLIEPVYVGDRLVLPDQAKVSGHVVATPGVDRSTHINALLDGDLTPLRVPVVSFDTVALATGVVLPMHTVAHLRQARLIRFLPGQKKSLWQWAKETASARIKNGREQIVGPHKSDRLLQWMYGQVPYHPQRIWAETDFDAELMAPLLVPIASAAPVVMAPADTLLHAQPIVRARLIEGVSSESAKNGDTVHAVLTEPAWDREHRLIFPEGAALNGVVLQARPSRSLGRNGAVRFAFRSMQPVEGAAASLRGQVTGAEGQLAANITVDQEGGVHANPDKNRFLGPLLLAALAAGGKDEDGGAGRQGLASNGLGIVVRVVGATDGSKNLAIGIGAYGFAKSLYRHFLAHGKPVEFPRDTAVEVQLSTRQ